MKKVIYWIVNLLEIAFLVGAYLVNYFTPKKMGMIRFVSYKNMIWEEQYNLQNMKTIAICIIFLLTIITIILYFVKNKKIKAKMIVATLLISGLYIGFTTLNSVNTYKAFYLISPLIGCAAILQILKALISILFTKQKSIK